MAEYRSQHYVPRAYLAGFADEVALNGKGVWVYERGGTGAYSSSPKKVAVSEYYYSFENEAGQKDHAIEKLLGKTEDRAIPLLRELAGGRDVSALSPEQREWVAVFLGYMSVRIPGFRKNVEASMAEVMTLVGKMAASQPKYFERTMREAARAAGKELTQDPEEVRQFVLRGEYEVTTNPAFSLAMMLEMGLKVAEYILNFEWRVLDTDGDLFITSDRPVVLVATEKAPFPFNGAGWLTPNMEATFPLSPKACLLISLHHPAGRERIASAQVAEINLRTSAHADLAVFASRNFDVRNLAPPLGWTWWNPVTAAVRADWLAAMRVD